jgi:niacin transporter
MVKGLKGMAVSQRAVSRGRSSESGSKASGSGAPAHGVEALGTAGVCIALGIVLPFFVHPFGISARVILPMHFPVFLAGMLLSPFHAAIVGVLAPALSMGFTGLPTADQTMRLIPELAVYGAATSVMVRLVPRIPGLSEKWGKLSALVLAMLVAMILGRAVYVAVSAIMGGFEGLRYYATILLVPAIPGIVAQLILIPPLAIRLQRMI